MEAFLVFTAFAFGLAFGSFYNVIIYRLPRQMSIIKPGSRCPACGHELKPLELVPLFSYIWLGGRCLACRGRISRRYPLIELATGLSFAFFAWRSPDFISFLAGSAYFSFLLILTAIDLDHQLLPNVLTLSGVGAGLLFSLLGRTLPFGRSVLGAVVGFSLIFALVLASRGKMGMGDAKLLAMIGSFVGWQGALLVLFLGAVFTVFGGGMYLWYKKLGMEVPIPFGPGLAAAALIVYLWI